MSDKEMARPILYVQGMHGMGDNLHQRALLKKWRPDYEVWLETSWPQIYHDMPDLNLLARGTKLRTQLKNAAGMRSAFRRMPPRLRGRQIKTVKVHYFPHQVREHGSVVGAMLAGNGFPAHDADLTFPVPDHWTDHIRFIVERAAGRPIMLYRPLVERPEWGGCASRNPDFDAYKAIHDTIRDPYFVVSVADLVPDVEWISGHEIDADMEFHRGELGFEALAALAKHAALVYASPGFAIPLARCLGTPCVCVFGGYEDSSSFRHGNGPYLGLDPIRPCQCFSHTHSCEKAIDLPAAITRAKDFSDAAIHQNRTGDDRLVRPAQTVL